MGGCQNYGPFLGTLNIRCRTIMGAQKGTIILTTTQMRPLHRRCRTARKLHPMQRRSGYPRIVLKSIVDEDVGNRTWAPGGSLKGDLAENFQWKLAFVSGCAFCQHVARSTMG